MAAKLTRLTNKIAIQLHLVAFTVLSSGGQSGNFRLRPRILEIAVNFVVRNQICKFRFTARTHAQNKRRYDQGDASSFEVFVDFRIL
jgi:hypothetical protein